LNVVEQKEKRKNDRREGNEKSGCGIERDRADRGEGPTHETRHLCGANLADVKAVQRQFQRRKVLVERVFEANQPALRRSGVARNVRRQELGLIDRQWHDDNQEYRNYDKQSEENDRDRDRLGQPPFQAPRDRLYAERNEGGDQEDRERARYVPRKPQRKQRQHDGAGNPGYAPPEVAA
jgi:hypothetical protein